MIDALALLKAYHAALNAFDLEKVSSLFAEDAIYISPGLNGELRGRENIMRAMRDYFAEYPNQISVDDEVVEITPSCVRAKWRLEATSATTGVVMRRSGEELVTFNQEGKIMRVEVRDA
jgi:uncharacterized protein (TIGR02246 family)